MVGDFIVEYHAGRTPNPCPRCNEKIKFATVLERGFTLGFDTAATGHYARAVDNGPELGLHRTADPDRDQFYVFGVLNQGRLRRSLFPLADMPKPQVRAGVRSLDLGVAGGPDSYDICFISDGSTQGYLRAHLDGTPRPIVGRSETELGRHREHHSFAIGQHRGLDLCVPVPDDDPHYVLRIESTSNHVIVGPGGSLLVINLTGIRLT